MLRFYTNMQLSPLATLTVILNLKKNVSMTEGAWADNNLTLR